LRYPAKRRKDSCYPLQDFDASDGTPGAVRDVAQTDTLDELVIVDARRKDAGGKDVPLLPADDVDYFPQALTHLPRANDPAGIDEWLDGVVSSSNFFRKVSFAGRHASSAVTGLVNVAEFPAGTVNPVLVATTRNGGRALLPLGTNLLYSVGLPRWLAFSADLFATAATVQGTYAELKETYASKQPDGKLSALPSLTGGISEENGYLTYAYGLGVAWKEGDEAPGEGGLGIGPGLLGLEFEATASVGFSGETTNLSFTVGGTVGKEEIDLSDYMPGFGKALGLEGTINSVGGTAETKHSGQFDGGDWTERELETAVGAYLDLTIRYNLEGITGKIPYVGPFITAADKTGLLKLYARLDAGGRVESKERWRTVEQERKPVGAGDDYEYPGGYVIIPADPDPDPLTPSRHAFGGTRDTSGSYTNQFALGMTFATSFEGSGLGDHLYLRTGLEITGNESDLVAGKPSLVIIPNTFGDWPPIKRVSGDVNAFANAKLDVYVTEIEKTWTMNLARIDHQFTTDSLMTMTDLNIAVTERERAATAFTGTFPVLVRNLPKGSSFAVGNGWVIFGRYNDATRATELVVSLFDGTSYGEPTVLASVEGLGRMRLTDLGGGRWLLVWEERPGIASNPSAPSVLHAAFYDAGAWGAPHAVVTLDGYLTKLEVFATRDKLSIPYVESYESNDSTNARIRAVVYGGSGTTWSAPYNIRASSVVLDRAMACAGAAGDAVWSDEPGRIFYIQSNGSVSSRYWDGERFYVPGKADYLYITAGPVQRTAICPAGTNDALYAALLESDGEIRLRRYVPDASRDPANLDYNWNGRTVTAMWPELGVFADGADGASELACGWLAQTNLLLTAWARNGLLHAAFTDPNQVSNSVLCRISSNGNGQYGDIRIEPVSNATARIYACYRSESVQELRVFTVSADGGVTGPNPDATGSFTLIYLAGAGGTVDGVTTQYVAQGESGAAVTAAGADTGVVFRAWSDGCTGAVRTDANVQSNLTVTARFRSVGGADLDWYSAYGFAPTNGESWSALDARAVPDKGTTLFHEFVADTDPNATNSVFRVEAVDPGPPVSVRFTPGSTSRHYTLQFVDDLIGGVWSNVPGQGPRLGAGETDTMTDSDTAPTRFYRVKVEVP